jgi:hypothetical protein
MRYPSSECYPLPVPLTDFSVKVEKPFPMGNAVEIRRSFLMLPAQSLPNLFAVNVDEILIFLLVVRVPSDAAGIRTEKFVFSLSIRREAKHVLAGIGCV